MDDIKDVAKAIIEPILNFAVKNSKDEEEKKETKDEAKNEKVDKRDIIRQIMAIAGKEEASEDVKTIAKLAEKLAYDDSEAGTTDNKKAKNEDEKEEKEEKFEEEKEIANKKAKNEEKDKKEDEDDKEDKADNKCKNSMDDVRKAVFGGQSSNQNTGYLTKAQRLELGNNY